MATVLYFIISAIAFMVLIFGIKSYRERKDVVFLLVLAPLLFLWYDSFMIGLGQFIGQGPLLEVLSWPRYIAHELLLPIWIIAAGALARRADFKWAQSKIVMAIFCLVGTFGIGLGVTELLHLELFPACLMDTVRYVPYVREAQACVPEMAGMGHRAGGPPLIPILSTVLFIVIGLMMWIKRGWPWLFLGAALMFVGAGLPQSIAGPLLANMVEPIVSLAAIMTARRFTHQG